MINLKKVVLDVFTDEESDINPYYQRFKSHQLEIAKKMIFLIKLFKTRNN